MLALSAFMAALFMGKAMGSSASLPSAYDLRTYGYVPAVQDQGKDKTCWTFAAMAALKSNYLMNVANKNYNNFLGNDSDLSKLHLAWFSFKNPNRKQNFAFIKNRSIVASPTDDDVLNHPGNPQMAVALLSRHDGPVRESALPYSGAKPSAGKSPRDYALALRLVNAAYIDNIDLGEDIQLDKNTMIKAVLQSNGAVDVGVYWSSGYMSAKYAYYYPYESGGGHAVTIIGWDDNYSRENFGLLKPKNNGAWLVQNSWGTSWGDDGYFWMSYEQEINYAMAFDTEAVNPRVREYYHDDLGLTHEVLLKDSNGETGDTTVVNVFKVKGDHEKLREIGYYSTSKNFMKFITVYDLGMENTIEKLRNIQSDSNSVLSMSMVLSVGLGYGYAVENLPKIVPLTKDHYFAVMMVDAPFPLSNDVDSSFKYSIAAEAQIPNRHTAYAEVNKNETYFKVNDDDWQDAKNYKFQVGDVEVTGFNACIKGFSYVPDERVADDWTLIKNGKKAQLSISLLRETSPERISVQGTGLSNIMYKIEPEENSDTGGAAGKFYTLNLICDVENFNNAAITSMIIDGEETITGYVDVAKSERKVQGIDGWTFTDWEYSDIAKVGVKFSNMTTASGTIDSTEDYVANNEFDLDDDDNIGSGGGSGGGCNSVTSALGLVFVLSALLITHRTR